MTLNPKALGLASALTFAIFWVVCSVLVWLSPALMMQITGHMVHIDATNTTWSLDWIGFFIGLVVWTGLAGATGWLIAVLYNRI